MAPAIPPGPAPLPSEVAEAARHLLHLHAPGGDSGEAAWEDRVSGLADLVSWAADARDGYRLAALAAACRGSGDAAARLRAAVVAVAEGGRGLRLLSEVGLPGRLTMAEETFIRAVRAIVPPVRESRDLGDVLHLLFREKRVAAWLAAIPREALAEVLESAGLDRADLWPTLRLHLAEAVRIHAIECSSIGLSGDMRRAFRDPPVAQSPFHRMSEASADLLDALSASPPHPAAAAAARSALEEGLAGAQVMRKGVIAHLQRTGVSADLVARLECLRRGLGRIGRAAPLLAPLPGERPAAAAVALLQMLVVDLRREESFGNVFRERLRLLAKKIAERSGRTGTHYVTSSRTEWWSMLRMGVGGGLVMALAILAKSSIYTLHLPPFWISSLVFLVYGTAFLAIFALHWTLATKQPPMTAAAFAVSLTAMEGAKDATPVMELLARISRSQFAGLLGNILGVAAAAAALEIGWVLLTGGHVFGKAEAEHTLGAHHPFHSMSLPLAVLTGCAVWLASMAAGWAEDAAAYGRLEESFEGGEERGGRLTRWIVRNVSGVVGNIFLAFLLVCLSFTGKVTGLPIDFRHVTVSAGSVVLSCLTLGHFLTEEVAWAVVGVFAIGALNILTGFVLSLRVALRSRNAGARARIRLVEGFFRTPLGNPVRFVYPVEPDSPGQGAGAAP